MEFEFINKIWLPHMGYGKKRRVFLFAIGGFLLLLNLFQALMDGFDKVNWIIGLAVPALLVSIGLMGTRHGGYTTAQCKLIISCESVRVIYPSIDRLNKMGIHTEIQSISKQNISDIQFSEILRSIRILGQVNIIEVAKDNENRDKMLPCGISEEIVLYPPDAQVEQIITAFSDILKTSVRNMDAFN